MNPLHEAVSKGQQREVELLLSQGADVSFKDGLGWSLLHWAAEIGHPGLVELLLANGAEVNTRSLGGGTPLHNAASLGRDEVVRILLANGADVNVKDSRPGRRFIGPPRMITRKLSDGSSLTARVWTFSRRLPSGMWIVWNLSSEPIRTWQRPKMGTGPHPCIGRRDRGTSGLWKYSWQTERMSTPRDDTAQLR